MFRPTFLGLSRAIAQPATTLTVRATFQSRFYSAAAAASQPTTTTTTTTATTTTTTTPSQQQQQQQQPTISTPPAQPTTTPIQTQAGAAPTQSTKPVAKPYLVGRTWTQRLPVYHLAKRGGNKKLTQIKKVQGDGQALRRDLAQFLGLEVKEVRVKVPTGHLEVDGHRKEEIVKFLDGLGF